MSNIEELKQWDEGVYELTILDPVKGGADGVDNLPHKHLANRTLWLKSMLGLPVGFQTFEIKETPAANQLFQFGGEFARSEHPELWAFIQTQTTLLKSEAEWQTENNNNGMCGYFSTGDGSTTFRLMNLIGATVKGVDNSSELVGRFETDRNKSHNHARNTYGNTEYFITTSTSGTTRTFGGAGYSLKTGSSTGAEGSSENTIKNIGALPLIVSRKGI